MRTPVAFVGHSGSGKTTLICELIPEYTRRGQTVAVIKHTHHDLGTLNELGKDPSQARHILSLTDTDRFLAAGAAEAILADDFTAIHYGAQGSSSWSHAHPLDLLRLVHSEVVLVEGFKGDPLWPKVVVTGENALGPGPTGIRNVIAVVSGSPSDYDVPRFDRGRGTDLIRFLDTIPLP